MVLNVMIFNFQLKPHMERYSVYTSDTTKLKGGEWTTNGTGLKVSSQFGFGAIDAEAMVTRAKNWINVPNQLCEIINSTIG